MERSATPSLAQIDAVLAFLPTFEQPGFVAGRWSTQRLVLPVWEEHPAVRAFVTALSREGFIVPFDWGAWSDEARRYAADATALAGADLATLCQLLTTYVRADRFTSGTLASAFETGLIVAMLRRLRAIRAVMGEATTGTG